MDLIKLLDYVSFSNLCRINGKLLGDGNLTIENGKSPRLRFSHSIEDYQWCHYCYSELVKGLPLNPPKYKLTIDPRLKKGYSESYYVQSKTHKLFTLLLDFWYEGKQKVIPFNLLEYTLTPECLAWWYQDDGYLKKNNNRVSKLVISAESFSTDELYGLKYLLKKKWNLNFSVDKQNRLLLYNQTDILYFLKLVAPFYNLCMNRKFLNTPTTNTHFSSFRTTIHLPKIISIDKPTQDIHYVIEQFPYWDTYSFLEMHSFYSSYSNLYCDTQSYQITLPDKHLAYLNKMKVLYGWNNSMTIFLTWLKFIKEKTIPT